ncbi:hypothetical protein BP6252_10125 [Coleophoma cylindrospora]|uniref:Uncharacterized protein n=1 Tax=Coleophoma cylindrospora TaxID=1849047 RepID=A0A3D8QXS2_9HELO|nr:hypothetical protein BP6252_10125 [Coleophoma cylindrospora]
MEATDRPRESGLASLPRLACRVNLAIWVPFRDCQPGPPLRSTAGLIYHAQRPAVKIARRTSYCATAMTRSAPPIPSLSVSASSRPQLYSYKRTSARATKEKNSVEKDGRLLQRRHRGRDAGAVKPRRDRSRRHQEDLAPRMGILLLRRRRSDLQEAQQPGLQSHLAAATGLHRLHQVRHPHHAARPPARNPAVRLPRSDGTTRPPRRRERDRARDRPLRGAASDLELRIDDPSADHRGRSARAEVRLAAVREPEAGDEREDAREDQRDGRPDGVRVPDARLARAGQAGGSLPAGRGSAEAGGCAGVDGARGDGAGSDVERDAGVAGAAYQAADYPEGHSDARGRVPGDAVCAASAGDHSEQPRGAEFGHGAAGGAHAAGDPEVLPGVLQAEIATCMRLLGVEKISELGPQYVNSKAVELDIFDGPGGTEELRSWAKAHL